MSVGPYTREAEESPSNFFASTRGMPSEVLGQLLGVQICVRILFLLLL